MFDKKGGEGGWVVGNFRDESGARRLNVKTFPLLHEAGCSHEVWM